MTKWSIDFDFVQSDSFLFLLAFILVSTWTAFLWQAFLLLAIGFLLRANWASYNCNRSSWFVPLWIFRWFALHVPIDQKRDHQMELPLSNCNICGVVNEEEYNKILLGCARNLQAIILQIFRRTRRMNLILFFVQFVLIYYYYLLYFFITFILTRTDFWIVFYCRCSLLKQFVGF